MHTDREWRNELRSYFRQSQPLAGENWVGGMIKIVEALLKADGEERERKLEGRIGMLRQWINEDVVTENRRMVSNRDLRKWLGLSDLRE